MGQSSLAGGKGYDLVSLYITNLIDTLRSYIAYNQVGGSWLLTTT